MPYLEYRRLNLTPSINDGVRLGDVGTALVVGQILSMFIMAWRKRVLDLGSANEVLHASAILIGYWSPALLGFVSCIYSLSRTGLRWRTAFTLLAAVLGSVVTLLCST